MKKAAKQVLHSLGVLGPVQSLYFDLKSLTPTVARDEIALLVGRNPDTWPLPPRRLVFDIIACHWRAVYLTSGRLIVDDLIAILEELQRPLASFNSILDFGCGCGRLTRQIASRSSSAIHGSDYNEELVEWCRQNLPFGSFALNKLLPPISCASSSFDFVLARSVFTHLPQDSQVEWMKEFRRIMRPGALLYLTMHGFGLTSGLSQVQREAFARGDLVTTYANLAGENICSTYGSADYVQQNLLDGFALIRHIEGRPEPHLRQDVYVLERLRDG